MYVKILIAENVLNLMKYNTLILTIALLLSQESANKEVSKYYIFRAAARRVLCMCVNVLLKDFVEYEFSEIT
jgi:hypothetical protein